MTKKSVKKIESINDLIPDVQNANIGTVRGRAMLEDSLSDYGAGRGVVADRNGNIIAGNKTVEAAVEKGFEIVVIPSDGEKLVVIQRTDLDLYEDKRARELATADNRVGQVDLNWDAQALLDVAGGDLLDIDKFFDKDEFAALRGFAPETEPEIGAVQVDDDDVASEAERLANKFKNSKEHVKVVCPHCAKEYYLEKKDLK